MNIFYVKLADSLIDPKLRFYEWNLTWKDKNNFESDATCSFRESINIYLKI